MIFLIKGGMSLYQHRELIDPDTESKNRRLVSWQGALSPSLVGFTAKIKLQWGLWWWNLLTKNEIWESDIKDMGMMHFLTNMSYFEPNGIFSSVVYNYTIEISFFLHELHKPHKCRKQKNSRVQNLTDRPLVCQNVFQSSDPVRRFQRLTNDLKFHLCTSCKRGIDVSVFGVWWQ